MSELTLLNLLTSKAKYKSYSPFIMPHVLSKESGIIFDAMGDWFSTNDQDIRWEQFSVWFTTVRFPSWKEEKHQIYISLFKTLQHLEPDEVLENEVIKAFIKRDYCSQISDIAIRGAEGHDVDLEEVEILVREYRGKTSGEAVEDATVISADVEDLLEKTYVGGGYEWRLPEFRASLGPLRLGDFVYFVARPEAGKTTMLASESSYIAPQMEDGKHVVWFNNEEAGRKVMLRVIQATLGWTSTQIAAKPKEAQERYEEAVGGAQRVLIYDRATITPNDVEKILDKYPPGLIIFDQLRKMKVPHMKDGNDIKRLAYLAGFARGLAKDLAPVIGVHQAGGAAEGMLWIPGNMLEGSQTEVQGEVDVQIMLGKRNDMGYEYTRGINIVKNKLMGGGETFNESLRHAKWEVTIEPEIARYRGQFSNTQPHNKSH